MIAPREQESGLNILAFGLQPQEEKEIDELLEAYGGHLQSAHTELEVWSYARSGKFGLCILGQSENIQNPSYLVWLLKGITNHSRIILIYSEMRKDELQRLDHFHASFVLKRPIDLRQIERTIEDALNGNGEETHDFWSVISRWLPHRKRTKVH